jgi:hypothetical protein
MQTNQQYKTKYRYKPEDDEDDMPMYYKMIDENP